MLTGAGMDFNINE